ncbi:hypothetical protein PALB_9480 [Pseudoalteromonas luteoviolacea B = ATCC 29581]|nr:hypothetical protein PALB_9480 [Pseudoalteromonas luteoviolacea B = ATCC 29581]
MIAFNSHAQLLTEPCGPEVVQTLRTAKAQRYKTSQFNNINDFAIKMLSCVGDSDPKIRDGLVYETYQTWLRSNALDIATVRKIYAILVSELSQFEADTVGFKRAFTALNLSEVVRVDRLTPFLSPQQRNTLIELISEILSKTDDYRGFNQTEGWRHFIPHLADVYLQLALNPAINQSQAQTIVDALIGKVSPENHFYHFGEPKRLAMPIVYLLFGNKINPEQIAKRIQQLALPTPFAAWSDAYMDEKGLAMLHNRRAFLNALFVLGSQTKHEQVQAILPSVLDAIKELG